jgi:hypothetical protein
MFQTARTTNIDLEPAASLLACFYKIAETAIICPLYIVGKAACGQLLHAKVIL